MGLFSRSKKSSSTPTSSSPRPVKPSSRVIRGLKKHPSGFYKYAIKNQDGMPMASRMYWNTDPPTPCPEVQQSSVFDADGNDVERYDINELKQGKKNTHVFNVEYGSKKDNGDAVRSVGTSPDYSLIRSWLGQCDKEHKQCRADGNIERLKIIKLIDARNRRLIQYKPGVQYVALSYVWGGAPSPRRVPGGSFELPANISKTIEHAMVVADKIGIPFLWADAVCINQHDSEDKKQQLPLMDYIYEQAAVTVVALGEHASVGLPGVEDGPQRHRQLVAEFGPAKLLSRCPKLSSEIERSRWSTRGWTYQESLFSQRCIFFSPHQVYFHCNAMLCTEDSPAATYLSPATNTKRSAQESRYWATDLHYIRSNILWTNQTYGDIYLYIQYFGQYICRDVTYDEDAINAFSALLSRLRRDFFFKGFIQGIPKDDFRDGLLWAAAGNVSRRENGGFPSWSWAAWKTGNSGITYGPVAFPESEINMTVPHPLSISLAQDCLYVPQATNRRLSEMGLELQALWDTYSRSQKQLPAGMTSQPPTANALYIDGPLMTLPVTYDPVTQVIGFTAPVSLPRVRMIDLWPLLNEKCRRDFAQLPITGGEISRRDFLVMRAKHILAQPFARIDFTLMMLEWVDNSRATRAGILQISVESDLGEFWKLAEVRKGVLWLI